MNAYQRQLPLPDLMLRAFAELRTNPTISSYTFEDGTEHRRYPDILTAISKAIDHILDMLCSIIGLDSTAVSDFLDAFPAAALGDSA